MTRDKAGSTRKRRSKTVAVFVPVLGAAGLSLTLASAASAASFAPTAAMPAREAPATQQITLAEEEISGASLATFHVFDKERAQPARGTRFAMGVGGCGGCAGCGGCWTGTYYTDSVVGGGGDYVVVHPVKPRKYVSPSRRATSR
jgi:hypothetical protein